MICNFPSFAAFCLICSADSFSIEAYSNEGCFYDYLSPSQITLMNLYCGWKLNEGKYLICKIDFHPTFLTSRLLNLSSHVTLFIQLISLMNQTESCLRKLTLIELLTFKEAFIMKRISVELKTISLSLDRKFRLPIIYLCN